MPKTTDENLAALAVALSDIPCVTGVVLGGSRATNTATASSDVDIGVYYRAESLDLPALCEVAKTFDDRHRDGLICAEGGWGRWVNCGGWLTVDGVSVDVILRDMNRVADIVAKTDAGEFSAHYQTGHPHAFLDVIYRGELACAKVLCHSSAEFSVLKKRAEVYPDTLRTALLDFFTFEADFSCGFAEKYAPAEDAYYVAGHLFRAVSALNQALFALNRVWCLNEKKAVRRIDGMALHPADYGSRVNALFASMDAPAQAAALLRELCGETAALCAEHRDARP